MLYGHLNTVQQTLATTFSNNKLPINPLALLKHNVNNIVVTV